MNETSEERMEAVDRLYGALEESGILNQITLKTRHLLHNLAGHLVVCDPEISEPEPGLGELSRSVGMPAHSVMVALAALKTHGLTYTSLRAAIVLNGRVEITQ